MANSLLDFVMSLVRDPDAAARYAADPDRALADANLTGVTSADVENLIPVVTESMPVAGPTSFGAADPGVEAAGNVWASGAATAAFDAFAAPVPEPVIHDPVIDTAVPAVSDEADLIPSLTLDDEVSLQADAVVDAEEPGIDTPAIDDWTGVASASDQLDDAGPNFDFFS